MPLSQLLNKITDTEARTSILRYHQEFSAAEQQLLQDILTQFDFNEEDTQTLLHALDAQSRFQPDNHHHDDDEDEAAVLCQHCIMPPAPPLRDYQLYRQRKQS